MQSYNVSENQFSSNSTAYHLVYNLTKAVAVVAEQNSATSVEGPGRPVAANSGERTGLWKELVTLSRGLRTQVEIQGRHVFARLWTIFERKNAIIKAYGGELTEGTGVRNAGTECHIISWNARSATSDCVASASLTGSDGLLFLNQPALSTIDCASLHLYLLIHTNQVTSLQFK